MALLDRSIFDYSMLTAFLRIIKFFEITSKRSHIA